MIIVSAWHICVGWMPVSEFRTGTISVFCLMAGGLIFGGITLGLLLRWRMARKEGRLPTPGEAFLAGLRGVLILIVVLTIAYGSYGIYEKGSFMEGIGNVWLPLMLAVLLIAMIPAGGVALVVYSIGKPSQHL